MNTLCIYTAQFPYGFGEQFLETEIQYLVNTFTRVVIIPNDKKGPQRQVPPGVEILDPSFKSSSYSTAKGIKEIGTWVFYCLEDFRRSPNLRITLSSLMRKSYKAKNLHYLLHENNLLENTLHYTYWFDDYSTVLAILKVKKKINHFISRAHRFDLYEEKTEYNVIPFRNFQLRFVTKLFLISQDGVEYLKKRYPVYSSKLELSYLGVENSELQKFEDSLNTLPFLVVSCSRVIEMKRLDLIINSLAKLQEAPIKWVHFGDGPLLGEMQKMAEKILPENINFEFKGHVENESIYRFYSNHHVDLFINTSSSEGLPVTIMEAISFGIPVIATDVGGTSEITTPETGILLEESTNSETISKSIRDVLVHKSRNKAFRQSVYKFWNEHFNALKCYTAFSKRINEIN